MTLIKVTNHRLEVIKEKGQTKEEMVEKRKTEAIVAKQHRAREEINLYSKEKDESDTKDDIDSD